MRAKGTTDDLEAFGDQVARASVAEHGAVDQIAHEACVYAGLIRRLATRLAGPAEVS